MIKIIQCRSGGMVDAADSKSARVHALWGFDSPLRHQFSPPTTPPFSKTFTPRASRKGHSPGPPPGRSVAFPPGFSSKFPLRALGLPALFRDQARRAPTRGAPTVQGDGAASFRDISPQVRAVDQLRALCFASISCGAEGIPGHQSGAVASLGRKSSFTSLRCRGSSVKVWAMSAHTVAPDRSTSPLSIRALMSRERVLSVL